MLFKKLPDEIFKPLAGANRYLFEEILLFLYRYFTDEDITYDSVTPRRNHIISEIEELLERKGRLLRIIIEDGESDEETAYVPASAARYVYNRLVATGWLEEEEDGYQTNVIMPPHASLLLEALEGVAHAEKKNYGSTVASINLQLEAIVNQPANHAHAFIEVVRATRDFTRHLQNIFSGIRGFQEIITRQHNPKLALSTFFDEFVETILISDYKSLQAENNPFRHRSNVLQQLLHIEYDDKILSSLTKIYQADKNLNEVQAKDRVLQDIHFIARVFRSVDRRLDAIDRYRMRLESRVAEMVRYMDRNVPDLTNRGLKLLAALGHMLQSQNNGELADMPQPANRFTAGLLSPRSIRKPHKRRQPHYGELEVEQELSQEVRERMRLGKEYLLRRTISPMKIAEYILSQMEERESMAAQDFHVETVEELIAFSHIPFLSRMKGKPMPGMPVFVVHRTGERIDTDFMELTDFIVQRKA